MQSWAYRCHSFLWNADKKILCPIMDSLRFDIYILFKCGRAHFIFTSSITQDFFQLLLKAKPWNLKQMYGSKVATLFTVYNHSFLSYLTSSVEVYSCWPVFILHVQNCFVFLPCAQNQRSSPLRHNLSTMLRFEIIFVSVTNRVYFLMFPFISRPVSGSHTLSFSSFFPAWSWDTPCIQHILPSIFIHSPANLLHTPCK